MIVCCFPGTGKTELARANASIENMRIVELDSNQFDLSNQEGADKYVNIADSLSKQGLIVLVSTHIKVIDSLNEGNTPFIAVFPAEEISDSWKDRLYSRYRKTKLQKDFDTLSWVVKDCHMYNTIDYIQKNVTYWVRINLPDKDLYDAINNGIKTYPELISPNF